MILPIDIKFRLERNQVSEKMHPYLQVYVFNILLLIILS